MKEMVEEKARWLSNWEWVVGGAECWTEWKEEY